MYYALVPPPPPPPHIQYWKKSHHFRVENPTLIRGRGVVFKEFLNIFCCITNHYLVKSRGILPDTCLTRRRSSWLNKAYSTRLSRIMVLLFNKLLMTKHDFLRVLGRKKLEKLPFFSATPKITYIALYLFSMHNEYCACYDHIWTLSQCVE